VIPQCSRVLATEVGDIKEFPTVPCYLSYPAEAEDIKEYPYAVLLPLNEVTSWNASLLCSQPTEAVVIKGSLSAVIALDLRNQVILSDVRAPPGDTENIKEFSSAVLAPSA
jgi:hypothetical protein